MKSYQYSGAWPWPNFRPAEVSCRCCAELWPEHEKDDPAGGERGEDVEMPEYLRQSLDALQALRDAWGQPVVISSGHRCVRHNAEVGGTAGSQHLRVAFDCLVPRADQTRFVALAREAGFAGIGVYPNRGFVHLDLGPKRTWRG